VPFASRAREGDPVVGPARCAHRPDRPANIENRSLARIFEDAPNPGDRGLPSPCLLEQASPDQRRPQSASLSTTHGTPTYRGSARSGGLIFPGLTSMKGCCQGGENTRRKNQPRPDTNGLADHVAELLLDQGTVRKTRPRSRFPTNHVTRTNRRGPRPRPVGIA